MKLFQRINQCLRPARLTRFRMGLALVVAMGADALQLLFPVPPVPEIIDVIAMGLTSLAIGFHLLLLPTFVVEFIPLVDMLPTWTGCVVAVIALRKRESATAASVEAGPPVISPPPQLSPRIDMPPPTQSDSPKP
jgi:hypothetical protein